MHDEMTRLVQEASTGAVVAKEELLARLLPELRAFIRLRAGQRILSRESADDLVQSVCREMLEDMPVLEYRGMAAFKKWLYLNALRKIYDRNEFYQRQRRDVGRERLLATDAEQLSAFASLITPSRVAMNHEEVDRFETAFAQLSDEQREVITLARIIGLPHDEIAVEMGRTPVATRVLLHRALARLGTKLSELSG